eukprot:TRINITY_DN3444_c0_g1_i3.p1 TRINITY_DN3444_c0_g1~~TRINITY_DN3444_c0_g1_i3.p1  ORF type:complete len:185 (+),score=40.38 TRINITY_DN3444_c0_g1_i3:182-736(+)
MAEPTPVVIPPGYTPEEYWLDAMRAAMSRWTALKLAVENGWGKGFHTPGQRASQLFEDTRAFITEHRNFDPTELADYLDERMGELFDTICEDNSSDEISMLLTNLYNQSAAGDLTLAQQVIAQATAENVSNLFQEPVQQAPPVQTQPSEPVAPIVDEDGFTMVTSKKKGKGRASGVPEEGMGMQ